MGNSPLQEDALLNNKLRNTWWKYPEKACQFSRRRMAYSTPIYLGVMGKLLKCTIVFHKNPKEGTVVNIHSWSRKNTRPIRPATKKEVDGVGKTPGAGWRAL